MDSAIWSPKENSRFDRASLISKLFFDWARKPLIDNWKNSGNYNQNVDDAPNEYKADNLVQKFQICRKSFTQEKYITLVTIFIRLLIREVLLTSTLSFARYCVFLLVQVYFIGRFISSFNNTDNELYYTSAALIIISLPIILFEPHANINGESVGSKIRIITSSLIFEKVLKIRLAEIKRLNVGQMLNLFASDVQKFNACAQLTFKRVFDPIMVASTIAFLQINCGLPGTIGALVLFFLGFVLLFFIKPFKTIGQAKAKLVDQRLKLTTDMISEVKTIKMFCWENAYLRTIQEIRKKELKLALKLFYCKLPNFLISALASQIAIGVVLVLMHHFNTNFSARTLYTCFAVYNALHIPVASHIGRMVESVADAYVSYYRIQAILSINEVEDKKKERIVGLLELTNVISNWEPIIDMQDTSKFSLHIHNLTFDQLGLNVIIGPVGSGKSMLLLTLANELFIHSGNVSVSGSTTYMPQEPWLFPSTVRQNILFGLPYDELRYQDTIFSCALTEDISKFPDGDQTVIDDKGLTLSGGQKARIALARAMYRKSNIYLLDDPISAVDVKVGKHIWKSCFQNRNSTIILVTHNLHYLNKNDRLIRLENGRVEPVNHQQILTNSIENEEKDLNEKCLIEGSNISAPNYQVTKGKLSKTHNFIFWCKMACAFGNGYALLILILLSCLIPQMFRTTFDILSSKWIYAETHLIVHALVSYKQPININLQFLGLLIVMQIVTNFLKLAILIHFAIRAADRFHQKMLKSISRTNMYFFDTHLTGQIMNRFAKDLQFADDIILISIQNISKVGFQLIGLLANVIYGNIFACAPLFVLVCIILVILKVYVKVSKPYKMSEAQARSPIYSYMNCTLNGIAVIRSHENQQIMIKEFNAKRDCYSSVWFHLQGMNYWIAVLCETCGFLLITIIVILAIVVPNYTNSSKLGIAIVSTVAFGTALQYALKEFIEADYMMISLERLQEYVVLPAEEGYSNCLQSLPTNWPEFGKIVFKKISLFHGRLKALNNISFEIQSNEKVGIVGRTGAGKSSIVTALFRLAKVSGEIEIDGVDIKTLPLIEYRKIISIIPQNPVILSGSIRHYLDTLSEFKDDELWESLESVNLKDDVVKMEKKLDDSISQFSCGQMQLFCLARTLLNKTKILILDEATSNMDYNTEAIMQQLIATKFSNSTVIIITHRLQTIMNMDRIMVLRNGEVVEFDSPSNLLNTNSALKRLREKDLS